MSGSFAVLETAYDGKRGIICQSGDNGKLFDKTGKQILPWQDGQYAEVFLGIRDYDEISAKMSEEVKNSLLYHLGTHIQKAPEGTGNGVPCEKG